MNFKPIFAFGFFGYFASASFAATLKELTKDLLVYLEVGPTAFGWGITLIYWLGFVVSALLILRLCSKARNYRSSILGMLCLIVLLQLVQFWYVQGAWDVFSLAHMERKLEYIKASLSQPFYVFLDMGFMVVSFLLILFTLLSEQD